MRGWLAALATIGNHLRRIGAFGSERFQAPGGIFLDQPYGICGAGYRGSRGVANAECATLP